MLLSTLPFRARRVLLATTLAVSAVPWPALGAAPSYSGPNTVAQMEVPPRKETSGLAVSRRTADLFWTHDDSGGEDAVYAFDLSGRKRGTLHLTGVDNRDWEDLASFEKDGRAWLLVADTGDNDGKRDTVRLHIVEEPDASQLNPSREVKAAPAYSIRFKYPDGPRDCEAVAVDAREGYVYLLTKRDNPPRLYRVPLAPHKEKSIEAKLLTTVPHIAGRSELDSLVKRLAGKKFSWPTAMDFSADGRLAVVLTYGEAMIYERREKQSWADAFAQEPTRLMYHGLPQAEAVCFSRDARSLFIASESSPALLRYDRD